MCVCSQLFLFHLIIPSSHKTIAIIVECNWSKGLLPSLFSFFFFGPRACCAATIAVPLPIFITLSLSIHCIPFQICIFQLLPFLLQSLFQAWYPMANQVKGKTQQSVNWSYTPAPKQSHLPPKSPFPSSIGPAFVDYNNQRNVVQQLPPRERELGYRQHHQRTSSESILIEEQPSWLEDLLNEPETPVRKGSHRRSASDSAAFLDVPIATSQFGNEHLYNANNVKSRRFFDSDFPVAENRLQHNSHHSKAKKPPIKNWDAPPVKSWDAPLASSLKGGSRGKVLPGGSCQMQDIDGPVSSSHKREEMLEWSLKDTANVAASEGKVTSQAKTAELDLDSKRAKQQFAQRSRVRKLQYISELERNVSALQAEESEVSAEVTFLNQQRIILTLENQALKQRIAGLVQEKMIKDAEHEMLVKEAQRLRLLCHQQHLQQHQPSVQSNHLKQAPGSLDYDLQQLKFSKLSLGSRENSEPKSSGLHGSFVLPTDIVAMRKAHDGNDSETSLNGRDASSTNVSCMFAGANKNVDKKRMMAGSGLVPVDFMLQNS